jgi:hypothetical protein
MNDEELRDLAQYIKAGYLGALRSNGDNFTDASATVFSDYVIARFQSLMAIEDASRDQQIALAARREYAIKGAGAIL